MEITKLITPSGMSINPITSHLIIDYSVIAQQAIGQVTGKNYSVDQALLGRSVSSDTMSEVHYQIANKLLRLVGAVNPDHVAIALDSKPYWRVAFYDTWYQTHARLLLNPRTRSWAVEADGKITLVEWQEGIEEWTQKNVTKAIEAELELNTDVWFSLIPTGPFADGEVDRFKALCGWGVDVALPTDCVTWLLEGKPNPLHVVVGHYKGKRSWKYDTYVEKQDFVDQTEASAMALARVIGAEVLFAEGSEADDVIACYATVKSSEGHTVTIASVDSDLAQLRAHCGENVRFLNLYNGVHYSTNSVEKEHYSYLLKVVGGDYSSDHVKGVRKAKLKKDGTYDGFSTAMAETGADKWLSQYRHNWEANKVKFLDPITLARNLKLIDLREAPEEIKSACYEVVTGATPSTNDPITLDDGTIVSKLELSIFGIKEFELELLRNDVYGLASILNGVAVAPIATESITADSIPAPLKPTFHVIVKAHPDGIEGYPEWSMGMYRAVDSMDALEQAKEALPQHAPYINISDGNPFWWVCPIHIYEHSEVSPC